MIDPLMGPGLPLSTPGIQPEDSIMVAGRKVWRFLLAEMLSHEEGTRNGEDIEALHDMRVATRRMRAAFDVFGNAFDKGTLTPHLKGLRLTGRILGKVRDLDVFLEKAGIYLSDLAESERHGLDPLLENWQLQRQVARQEMLAYLESKEYLRFVKRFNNFLEINETQPTSYLPHPGDNEIPHPVQVQLLAPVMIYQRLAEVRAFDNILVFASVEQLHMLRIQFKKLR
jgi:CHAD domain-containing protein